MLNNVLYSLLFLISNFEDLKNAISFVRLWRVSAKRPQTPDCSAPLDEKSGGDSKESP